jgi:hypothetical protein
MAAFGGRFFQLRLDKRQVFEFAHGTQARCIADFCPRASTRKVTDEMWTLRRGRVNNLLKTRRYVAAGPVSRILSAGSLRRDDHSSGPGIAARL